MSKPKDDLISRSAAIAELMQMVKAHEHEIFRGELLHYTGIKAMLEAQPAVDAVPVVRCKDCVCFRPCNTEEDEWSGRCANVYLPMNGETVDRWWFCADGERRDEGETGND